MKKNKKSLLFSIFGMSSIILPMTIVACQPQVKESNDNKDNKDQTNKPNVNPINPGNGEQNDLKPPVENPSNPEDGGKPGDKPEPEKNKSEKSVLFNSIAKLYLSNLSSKKIFKNNEIAQTKFSELNDLLNKQDISEGNEDQVLNFLSSSFAIDLAKLELNILLNEKVKVTTEPNGVSEEQVIQTFNRPFGQEQNSTTTDQITDPKQKLYSFIKEVKETAKIIGTNYIYIATIPSYDSMFLDQLSNLTNESIESMDNETINNATFNLYSDYKTFKNSSYLTNQEATKITNNSDSKYLVGIKLLQKLSIELLMKYNLPGNSSAKDFTTEISSYLTTLGEFLNKESKTFEDLLSKTKEFYDKFHNWNSSAPAFNEYPQNGHNNNLDNDRTNKDQDSINAEFNSLVDSVLVNLKNDVESYMQSISNKTYLYAEQEDLKKLVLNHINELIAKKNQNVTEDDLNRAKGMNKWADDNKSRIQREIVKWDSILESKANEVGYSDSLAKLRKSYYMFEKIGNEIASVNLQSLSQEQQSEVRQIFSKFGDSTIRQEYFNSFFETNSDEENSVKNNKNEIANKDSIDTLYTKTKSFVQTILNEFNSSMDKQEQTRSLKLNESDYVIE